MYVCIVYVNRMHCIHIGWYFLALTYVCMYVCSAYVIPTFIYICMYIYKHILYICTYQLRYSAVGVAHVAVLNALALFDFKENIIS